MDTLALRGGRWTPPERAFKASMLLTQLDMINRLHDLLPEGEFGILRSVMPACLHTFLGIEAADPDTVA